MNRIDKVNILGLTYSIQYVEKPSDVDIFKRESLWGQIDYWTRTIRVYDGGRPEEDIFQTVLHEILHGITQELHLKQWHTKEQVGHDDLDLVATALADVLFRNRLLQTEPQAVTGGI